jgi:hypothetical protein
MAYRLTTYNIAAAVAITAFPRSAQRGSKSPYRQTGSTIRKSPQAPRLNGKKLRIKRVTVSPPAQQTKNKRKLTADQRDGDGRRNFFEFVRYGELKGLVSFTCRSSAGDPV